MSKKLSAPDVTGADGREITASNIPGGKRGLDIINAGAMAIPPYDSFNFTYNTDGTISTMTFELATVIHTTLTYSYDTFQRVTRIEKS